MKPRSKRKRVPRGGVEDGVKLRFDTVSLATSLAKLAPEKSSRQSSDAIADTSAVDRRRIRIIQPYPFRFATFAKARWVGRTLVDVYSQEFGSYPQSYYISAIKAGRILVSGRRVQCDYIVKGGDELMHTVHRHEPAVGLAEGIEGDPPIDILHESESLLVVDKPSTLPIHPCGGYNFNSLFEVLSSWRQDRFGQGKLFNVHRLDRLTSGLVVVAKSSQYARTLSNCIMKRDGCEKIYLARVKGKFPLGLITAEKQELRYKREIVCSDDGGSVPPTKRSRMEVAPPCRNGEVEPGRTWSGGLSISLANSGEKHKSCEDPISKLAGLGYWFTDSNGIVQDDESTTVRCMADKCQGSTLEMLARAIGPDPQSSCQGTLEKSNSLWLNFACPCRIASHKNGVCEAGDFSSLKEAERKGIKPAQTSFAVLSYDLASDTSLIVAKPITGRTHQIRLHLQQLGHPIANDHCYGGEMWFGDDAGKEAYNTSREWLDRLDRGSGTGTARKLAPDNSTNADTPATEAELYHAAANRQRMEGETMLDFIASTCVWCQRCRGIDDMNSSSVISKEENDKAIFQRTLMEYLVRSQGIFLHALQYNLKMAKEDEGEEILCYRTKLPTWARQFD
mmetsp:Transcript_4687/g.10463  ORF Transcript_4687/g.10463 Transcript_4687/m.10463 type:complete len:620 (-) Transcript_4687:59-1918(-)